MRAVLRGFSLAESVVTLFLALVVLTVLGVHLQQLTRLSLTPLDQGWEALQLGLQRVDSECRGAYELTLGPASVAGAQAGIAAPVRLDAPGPTWTFDGQPVRFRYLVHDGQFVRQALAAGGAVQSEALLCAAESLTVQVRPNGLRAELVWGKQRVVREVYRLVR
ncbi:hypothetical protein ABS71_01635 [bacterium SCN 62-11]|nr:MAG: hypothetical protein ABS71_01635 [bacterium SCN 62-11]